MSESVLMRFDRAKQALVAAKNIDEVKRVRDQAEALRLYVRQQTDSLQMQNDIAEIKLRAERRAGELLAEMDKAKGSAGQLRGRDSSGGIIVKPLEDEPPTLSDLGISKSQSHRWQTEAQVPDEAFEQYVAETKASDEELTSKDLYRLGQRVKQAEEREQTRENVLDASDIVGQYRTLVIDPPWPVQKILRDVRPNQDVFDYPTMTIDEIHRLPIGELAYPDGCHVYLWTTHKYLPTSFDLFRSWGVRYQCLMTWHKNVGPTPFSWMYDTEHVLFGRVGTLQLLKMGLRLGFEATAQGHSIKPDVFYERVVEASPSPRLELFGRRQREGFEVWGNEV